VRRLRVIFYTVVLLLCVGLYGLFGTTPGFHLLLHAVNAWTSVQVSADSASGSLMQGLELGRLQIRAPGFSVTSGKTTIQLHVPALLFGKLDMSRLHMDDVDVALSESTPVKPGSAPVALPLAVAVDDLHLTRLAIALPGGKRYRLADVRLKLEARTRSLNWSRLSLHADNLTLHGDGQLRFGPPPRISSTLTWALQQAGDRPLLSGSTRLRGDTSALAVDTRLTQPVAATAGITVHDLLHKLRWEGKLSLPAINTAAVSDRLPKLRAAASLQGNGDLYTLRAQGSLVLSDIKVPGLTIEGTTANADLPLKVDIKADRSEGGVRADLNLAWSESGIRLRRQDLILTLPNGIATLALAGGGFKLGADAPIVLNGQQGEMHLQASGDAASVSLDAARIALDKGVIRTSGAFQRTRGGALQLSADWRDLSLPWRGDRLHSPRGELRVSGGLDDYRIDLSARLNHRDLPATSLQVHGSGNRHELRLEPARLVLLDGNITGTGKVTWGTATGLDIHFTGQGLNPGRQWPAWPGKLAAKGHLVITRDDSGYTLTLDNVDLHGRLREHPITLMLDSVIAPGAVTLNRAELTSDNAFLKLTGRLADDRYDLHWDINIPQVDALLPDGAGKVRGRGLLAGTPAQPLITGNLTVKDLRSPWLNAASIELTTDMDLKKTGTLALDLAVSDLGYRNLSLKQVQLRVSGTDSRHDYTLTAENGDGQLRLAGTGSYADAHWQGRTEQLQLSYGKFGTWQLRQPAVTRVSRDQVASEPVCLAQGSSSMCLDGDWQGAGHWDGQLSMQAMPLGMGKPWFPYFLDVNGNFDLQLNARRRGQDTRADADLTLSPGKVDFQIDVDQYQHFTYDSGTIKAAFHNGRLDTDALVHFTHNATPIHAKLRLSGLHRPLAPVPAAVTLRGSASGRVENLGFIATLTPYVTDVHGALAVDLDVKGTLAKPDITGKFQLTDAGFHVPDLGIELKKMAIQGHSTPAGRYELAGQWQIGKGSVHMKAGLREDPEGKPVLHAVLSGKDAEIINLPEAWAVASSALTLDVAPDSSSVAGSVQVSHALLDLGELKSAKPPASKDVVFVDRKVKPKTRRLPPMKTNVTVEFGDDIRIKGQGIKGKVKGKLAIRSNDKEELTGDGEIQIVDGTYSAYGQTLQIEEGKLIYQQSPLDNPEVRVRAIRKVEDVTAGVRVEGFLNDPIVTLFSTPPMTQEEILSYVVFGRPLDNLSTGQGTDLISAATDLGLQNSGFITGSIANTFSLDEFKIKSSTDTSGQRQASVVIGKYLTPKLYLSYGVGLFETLSTAKIRYNISRRWSVEAQQGAETSADVLFKIEK
jgi:translocation and assembly module TamB